MDKDITQLQTDVVDQNDLNNVQTNRMEYLEKVVEAMDDRMAKF